MPNGSEDKASDFTIIKKAVQQIAQLRVRQSG